VEQRAFDSTQLPGASIRGELLYGAHSCRCAIMSNSREVYRAFVGDFDDAGRPDRRPRPAKAGAPENPLLAELRRRGVPIIRAEKAILFKLAGDHAHQGIVLDAGPLCVDFLPAAAVPASRPAGPAPTAEQPASPAAGADDCGASATVASVVSPDTSGRAADDDDDDADDAIEVWEGVEWEPPTLPGAGEDAGAAGIAAPSGDASVDMPLSAAPGANPRVAARPRLLLVLDGVTDPQNVGACLRSALLLGANGVVLPQKSSAPLNGTVSRTSAGALEVLAATGAIRYAAGLPAALAAYRAAGWRVLGAAAPPSLDRPTNEAGDAAASAAAQGADGASEAAAPGQQQAQPRGSSGSRLYLPSPAVSRDVHTVLVLGSEGAGLRPGVRQACDAFVYVPTAADARGAVAAATAEAGAGSSGGHAGRDGDGRGGTGVGDGEMAVVAAAAEPAPAGTGRRREGSRAASTTASAMLQRMRRLSLVDSLNVSNAAATLLYQLRPLT
jgi:tRNA G18 (ribose-2'-O)-methylase SpoU